MLTSWVKDTWRATGWRVREGDRNRDAEIEIRTCIYQACQKKSDHHGSLTTASGQFNLIWSDTNKKTSCKSSSTLETLNEAHRRRTERQKQMKETVDTEKPAVLWRTNEEGIYFSQVQVIREYISSVSRDKGASSNWWCCHLSKCNQALNGPKMW